MKSPLTNTTIFFMVSAALLIDAVQALIELVPVAGQIAGEMIAIAAFAFFFIWFWMHGISFSSPKRMLSMGIGVIIELIPVVDILPGLTAAVALTIVFSKVPALSATIQGPAGFGGIRGFRAEATAVRSGTAEVKTAARQEKGRIKRLEERRLPEPQTERKTGAAYFERNRQWDEGEKALGPKKIDARRKEAVRLDAKRGAAPIADRDSRERPQYTETAGELPSLRKSRPSPFGSKPNDYHRPKRFGKQGEETSGGE